MIQNDPKVELFSIFFKLVLDQWDIMAY